MNLGAIPPAVVAAAAGDVRAYLRDAGSGEQALAERLATSAILLGEAFTGRAFVRRGGEEVIAASRDWRALAASPVTAIAGVTALPDGGAPRVLAAGDYAIDIDGDGIGWVRVTVADAARVAVQLEAGIAATWDALPAPLAQSVVMLAAHLFGGRDAGAAPPAAVSALWRPWRRMTRARRFA